MSRFDRYLFREFVALFGFFSLVLVLVYWINRAVGLFDRLVGDGQSALVFLEFSLLTIPNVVRLVLPVSAFAAVVYVTNRLIQDGEFTVLRATGFSPFRMARPVLVFGAFVALLMLALCHWVVPTSRAVLAERQAEIDANLTARLLSDGRFIHPSDGITFYIREISDRGELLDVFLADDRTPGRRTSYTARKALLLRAEDGPKLVMFDGMTQSFGRADGRLAVVRFADFTYDLAGVLAPPGRGGLTVEALPTRALIDPSPADLAVAGDRPGALRMELNGRFAQPLLALAAALLGFAVLQAGGYSRLGPWRQIALAVVLLILVQLIANWAFGAGLRQPELWALAYLAPATGLSAAAAALGFAARARARPAAAVPA